MASEGFVLRIFVFVLILSSEDINGMYMKIINWKNVWSRIFFDDYSYNALKVFVVKFYSYTYVYRVV